MINEKWFDELTYRSIGVQTAMEEMTRLEEKGTATPEELEALAQEVSSKVSLQVLPHEREKLTPIRCF